MIELVWPEVGGEQAAAVDLEGFPQRWFEPEALVAACEAAAQEPQGARLMLARLGMPSEDGLTTALSLRAAMLGAQQGRAFYHHELRVRIPMPEGLGPEVSVGHEGTVPTWTEGVLVEPKYFSFFQDAPLASYNPNHRGKWRAHELLHGAQGHLWNPTMTRFVFYWGARINELLPVVHWYGLDEMFRPRCPAHTGPLSEREYCAACEEAATQPFWAHDDGWRASKRAEALGLARSAKAHMADEWRACMEELQTGRRVKTSRGHLDASSDALGYLRGHWNRVTAWSFGEWTERFLIDGVDYFSDVEAYARQVAKVAGALVGGPLAVDPAAYERLRARRVLQDVGYRALLLLEHMEEGSPMARRAEDAMKPHMEHMGRLCRMFWDATAKPDPRREVPPIIRGLISALDDALKPMPGLTDDLKERLTALGYAWPNATHQTGLPPAPHFMARDQVLEGLRGACPQTLAQLKAPDVIKELAQDLAAHIATDEAQARYLLAQRFADWYGQRQARDRYAAALAEFEAWAALPPRRDEEAEDFAALPESTDQLTDGSLRCHATLRVDTWPAWLAAEVLDDPSLNDEDEDGWEDQLLAVIWHNNEQRAAAIDADTAAMLEAIAAGAPLAEWLLDHQVDAFEALLEGGFIVWLPSPLGPHSQGEPSA
jgi:hypothetical protein